MQKYFTLFFIGFILISGSCNNTPPENLEEKKRIQDSIDLVLENERKERERPRVGTDIQLNENLQFTDYTLENEYEYEGEKRSFQLEKIKEVIAYIENFQKLEGEYAVLQNYRNSNGEAPTVANYKRNDYKRVSDTLGTERYQSVPLYEDSNHKLPSIYGRDGSLVRLLSADSLDFVKIEGISFNGEWYVPKRYVKNLGSELDFKKIAVVDNTHQNIMTLEKKDYCAWDILSKNPATTGVHKPPYSQITPPGIYVAQEKKVKMFYTKDGTSTIEGYAPYATRFTNGAYIHGVPVNNPNGKIIEYSWSLGTTPRSHMCVRNASSHAKFVYDWIDLSSGLIIVID